MTKPSFLRVFAKQNRALATRVLCTALCAAGSASSPSTAHADEQSDQAADLAELQTAVASGRSPQPAQLNAFGCEGVNGVIFAGRYQAISVFADLAPVLAGDKVPARVFGLIAPGLLPVMLNAAYVEWKLHLNDRNMLVLKGRTLRPDGSALAVTLKLPNQKGVVSATIATSVATTGETTKETIVCSLR